MDSELAVVDGGKECPVIGQGTEGTHPAAAPLPWLFQSLEQLVEGSGVVDGSESVQIPCCIFVGESSSAVEVGNAPTQSTPSAGSFAVSFLASVDAEVIGVMDGGLGPQDAAFRSIGLS